MNEVSGIGGGSLLMGLLGMVLKLFAVPDINDEASVKRWCERVSGLISSILANTKFDGLSAWADVLQSVLSCPDCWAKAYAAIKQLFQESPSPLLAMSKREAWRQAMEDLAATMSQSTVEGVRVCGAVNWQKILQALAFVAELMKVFMAGKETAMGLAASAMASLQTPNRRLSA